MSSMDRIRDQVDGSRLGIVSPIAAIAAWELLVRGNLLDDRFFPAPSTVMATLVGLLVSGALFGHLAASMYRVILGFAWGASLGLLTGLAIGWSRIAERLLDPLIAALYPIPKLALLPLILVIFGIGEASKVVIVAIAVFFMVVINTAAGVRSIDPVLLDAARSYGARGSRMFLKVVLPAALPTIFTGFRLAMGVALIVIVAAEFVASNKGLGYLVWISWQTLATSKLFAGLVMIGLLGYASTYGLKWIGDLLMPWQAVEKRDGAREPVRGEGRGMRILIKMRRSLRAIFSISRQYFYATSADRDLPHVAPKPEEFEFKRIDHSNVDAIRPWKGRWAARRFRRLLNRGMIGVYSFAEGQVVGYSWGAIKTGRFDVSCAHNPIEVGDAFTGTGEVRREYRRRGLATYQRHSLFERIREIGKGLGINRICGTVLVQNTPMHKLIERQGATRIQEIVAVKVTPWVFMRWTWQLDGEGGRKPGSGRPSIRLKYPEIFWDPLLVSFWGRTRLGSRALKEFHEGIQ